ncbi:MAG TPA: DnaJ domain-containing protein [Pyrinomonadaceae bacterium]|nr:DnaJ domain-containing protein [Pyrinomonadaceae bacterium]
MSPENGLEIKSTIEKHPLAELIVEIRQNNLGGSLRLSVGEKKAVIYFDEGRLIYAVSNAREHRLFSHLLKENLIEQKELAQFPIFAKDHEFAAALKASGRLNEEQLTKAAKAIVRQIVLDSLSWIKGDFTFTPLARVREDLKLDVEIGDLLMNYGRCFDTAWVMNRFRSFDESFTPVQAEISPSDNFRENESILLVAFGERTMTAEALRAATRMPESLLFSGLYTIWLGGYVKRANWNPAFSDLDLKNLSSAKLHLVKKAEDVRVARPAAQNGDGSMDEADQTAESVEPTVELSGEEYLARFENYESLYDLLAIDQNAPTRVVREKYLALARSFHPDRYRREDPELFKKMQAAFTELSFAHETLRDERLRRNYDQKLESERAFKKRVAERGDSGETLTHGEESGLQNFEAALACIGEGDLAGAATHLSRAVHYSPQNALYHAHYGKVLSESAQFKFKAEGELQTAVRLDAKNWKIREMLIEFYTDYDMTKRAEGEIRRFLELVPNHKDAMAALRQLAP